MNSRATRRNRKSAAPTAGRMTVYFTELATAFVRGRLGRESATVEDGLAAGLRLHKFKAKGGLARVRKVLGILRGLASDGLAPENLLDIGSGRGTFLWPLLSAFPALPVTCVELSERRATDLGAVRRGGIERLNVVRADAQKLAFAGGSFDVVTMLEVLEHLEDPQAALRAVVAAARRFVIVSVPSVADDNPQHIHLFSPDQLRQMAADAGCTRITLEHVLNHRVLIMRVAP